MADRLEQQFVALGRNVVFIDLDALPEEMDAGVLILMSPPSHCDDDFIHQSFACLQLAAPSLRHNHGWFITISMQDGQFGFANSRQPLAAGLAGLSKTASHEWPEVRCRALDIASNIDVKLLFQDICADDDLIEVGLSRQQRCTPVLSLQDTEQLPEVNHARLNQGDVVLVSGGARGVTAQVCQALAVAYQPRLILLGRSAWKDEEDHWPKDESALKKALMQSARSQGQKISPRDLNQWTQSILNQRQMSHHIEKMRQAGAEVTYFQVDMCDAKAVAEMVRDVRHRWGPIQGVVHGAGVLADRLIEDKTPEQFQLVYSTKVQGLRSLLDATDIDQLKVLVLFSSSTGRFGRKGQVDYAVANEVMNKMAQQYQQRKRACRVVSVNWGPWDGGMVTPALKALFASEGIGVIDQQMGADYLADELQRQGQTEIVILGERDTGIEEVISLSVSSHSFLASHQLNGQAVLPAAMMLEWFVAVANRASVHLTVSKVECFQVLKGVTLSTDQRIDLTIQVSGFGQVVHADMHSEQGIHARATLCLGDAPSSNIQINLQGLHALNEDPYANKQLFHGDHFAILEGVSLGDSGVMASVNQGGRPCDWMSHVVSNRWKTSPLAIDAAFQMAILWCWQRYDMPSLPSSWACYQQFKAFPQQVNVHLKVISHQEHQMVADIEFIDAESVVVARIEGYVCTMSVGLKDVFLNS